MSVTFLHTADWQIGKPFARVPDDEKRTLIRQARIDVIQRLGELVEEKNAKFVLVAGDLFDSPTISKAVVSATCSAIGALKVPVLVIPGNHDFGGPGCLWEQEFFLKEQQSLAPNLRVLLEREPIELDECVIFPCPLLRRHESRDPCGWLEDFAEADFDKFGGKARIVLAHGSIQGFDSRSSEEGAPNLISLDRIPPCFDYIALGDWHGTKEVGQNRWYAGTPEQDRFARGTENDPGNTLAVTIRDRDSLLVEKIQTGRLGWHFIDFTFSDSRSIEDLEAEGSQRFAARAGKDLLHLTLRGSIDFTTREQIDQLVESWNSRLLRIKLFDETTILPSQQELEALVNRAGDPLIARVAAKLLLRSESHDPEEQKLASLALQELHQVVAREKGGDPFS